MALSTRTIVYIPPSLYKAAQQVQENRSELPVLLLEFLQDLLAGDETLRPVRQIKQLMAKLSGEAMVADCEVMVAPNPHRSPTADRIYWLPLPEPNKMIRVDATPVDYLPTTKMSPASSTPVDCLPAIKSPTAPEVVETQPISVEFPHSSQADLGKSSAPTGKSRACACPKTQPISVGFPDSDSQSSKCRWMELSDKSLFHCLAQVTAQNDNHGVYRDTIPAETNADEASAKLLSLQQLTALIEGQPEAATLWIQRGAVFMDLKRYYEAADDFSQAIRLLPDQPQAYRKRAEAYYMLGKEQLSDEDRTRAKRLYAGG